MSDPVSRGLELLESLTTLGSRTVGSVGNRRAGRLVVDAFEDIGLRDVRLERFETAGWSAEVSAIDVEERIGTVSASHHITALPGSPSGHPSAQLCDVGYGLEESYDGTDVSGRIALVHSGVPEERDGWVHAVERYYRAVEHGAAGFILVSDRPGCLPRTTEIGFGNRPAPVPAVGVSRELGHRLRQCLARDTLTVTLVTETTHSIVKGENVVASTGGEGRPLTLCAHYDAHELGDGALDNACGCALLVGVSGQVIADSSESPLPVRVVALDAEETGHRGALAHVRESDWERPAGVVNFDGNSQSTTPMLWSNGIDAFEAVFNRVARDRGRKGEVDPEVQLYGDQWPFYCRGVPSAMLGTVPTDGRGWTHTHADTHDKVDEARIREFVPFVTAFLSMLSDVPLDPFSPAAVRSSLTDRQEFQLHAADRWPEPFTS